LPSALKLVEKLEGVNPTEVMGPRFTMDPPVMFRVNVNVSAV
jgi:hypothetical protein